MKNIAGWIVATGLLFFSVGCGSTEDEGTKTYTQVQSMLFKSANYDTITQKLTLTFQDDKVHEYYAVPKQLGEEFMAASSPDNLYNQKIKSNFEFHSSVDSENNP